MFGLLLDAEPGVGDSLVKEGEALGVGLGLDGFLHLRDDNKNQ